jgi:hypothetical protein
MYHPHLHGRGLSQGRNQYEARGKGFIIVGRDLLGMGGGCRVLKKKKKKVVRMRSIMRR